MKLAFPILFSFHTNGILWRLGVWRAAVGAAQAMAVGAGDAPLPLILVGIQAKIILQIDRLLLLLDSIFCKKKYLRQISSLSQSYLHQVL